MIDLDKLKQFVAFEELGTLRNVAEHFYLSTPSITRSMQHLEQEFGVTLFKRDKNKIELTDTGKFAIKKAKNILENVNLMVEEVRTYELRKRTIVINSCAPAPLWRLSQIINTKYPDYMVSSIICQSQEVLNAIENKKTDLAILPFFIEGTKEFMKEKLYVCVPINHDLAKYDALTFDQINGFNFLLRSELGFWDTLCREKMPASKFLVQTEPEVFDELVNASSLPCFTTDYTQMIRYYPNRINIPIVDEEANITFYITNNSLNI